MVEKKTLICTTDDVPSLPLQETGYSSVRPIMDAQTITALTHSYTPGIPDDFVTEQSDDRDGTEKPRACS